MTSYPPIVSSLFFFSIYVSFLAGRKPDSRRRVYDIRLTFSLIVTFIIIISLFNVDAKNKVKNYNKKKL